MPYQKGVTETEPRQRATPTMPVIALSMADAARAIGVSKPTLYLLDAEGKLKTFVVGRRRLVSPEALRDCVRLLEREAAKERGGRESAPK